MKKIITFLFVVIASAIALALVAACDNGTENIINNLDEETETEAVYEYGLAFYLLSDGTYTVKADDGAYLAEIEIPEEYNGITITRVAAYGFYGLENLTTITIPSSVTYIGDYAFAGCEKLESVYIGNKTDDCYAVNGAIYCGDSQTETGEDAFYNTSIPAVYISDSYDNDTLVDVRCNAGNGEVSSVKITATLNTTTDIEFENSFNLNSYTCTRTADFGTYGLFKDITVEFCTDDGKTVKTVNTSGVAVSADEYNIAQLNGTYGPLVFSLKLCDITENGTIPTFVALERTDTYNWDSLPYNMQCFPMLTYEKATTNNFHDIRGDIADYIAELYSLNTNSHFTLYAVDSYAELYLQYFVANHIAESNYNVVLLSDGTATATWLSAIFGDESVTSLSDRYDELYANYQQIKQYVWDSGTYDEEEIYSLTAYPYTEYEILPYYNYVIVNEEGNFAWWVNRLRAGENLTAITAKDGGSDFVTEIRSVTTEYYTNNLLAALDDGQAAAFKALYKFDEDAFSEADEAGTKVMVILGTSWATEEDTIYDYIRMTIDYYGDGYTYYYKPHPGYPTTSYPARQDILDRLAEEGYTIYELEASIAAEIFIYYFPDIYLSGWQSTTFYSVDGAQALAVYNIDRASAEIDTSVSTYADYIDIYITSVAAAELNTEYGLNFTDGRYYLVEYNNSTEAQAVEYNRHEIAIYCFVSYGAEEVMTVNYYKLDGGNLAWTEVNANGTAV